MKGYKGMESDMTCLGMKFEVGKAYRVDGDIELCKNGLHFCERLTDVFDFYPRDGNRFFEVEAQGIIRTDERKSATSDLVIVRELDDVEINRISYGSGCGDGSGSGDGNGYVYGYGNGYGDGNGYGYGDGSGSGDGSGDGSGNGSGDGCGYVYGYGNGYGDGSGYGNGNGNGSGDGSGYIQRVLLFA